MAIATLLAGCAHQPNGATYGRATAHETIEIRTAPGMAKELIAGLQRRIPPGKDEMLDVQPLFEPRQTTESTTASYAAALSDAQAKAHAIASRIGVTLSAPRSVVDVSVPGVRPMYDPQGVKSLPAAPARVPAGAPLALAVTYFAVGDPSRQISVMGFSESPPYRQDVQNAPGVRVSIYMRASDGATAAAALRSAEDSVRRAADSLGIPARALSVSSAGFSEY